MWLWVENFFYVALRPWWRYKERLFDLIILSWSLCCLCWLSVDCLIYCCSNSNTNTTQWVDFNLVDWALYSIKICGIFYHVESRFLVLVKWLHWAHVSSKAVWQKVIVFHLVSNRLMFAYFILKVHTSFVLHYLVTFNTYL